MAVLVVTVLAGCGQAGSSSSSASKTFSGEEKQVADTVDKLASDGRSRKAAKICDELLATDLQNQIKAANASCADEMEKAIEDADGFDLQVTDVTVSGASARAQVKSTDRGKDVVRTFQFAKEQGGWRIKSFG